MRSLIRLAIVAATFLALPAIVVGFGPSAGLSLAEAVVFAVLTVPASGVLAVCVARSFHRADQTIAAARRIQSGCTPPTDTGETR
jgi:hypothetical protein